MGLDYEGLLNMFALSGSAAPVVMELPPYRFPTIRGLVIHTWERTWQYIKKAGTVILAASILIWAFTSFPARPSAPGEAEALAAQVNQPAFASLSAVLHAPVRTGAYSWVVESFTVEEWKMETIAA